jgi:hypothetical protein
MALLVLQLEKYQLLHTKSYRKEMQSSTGSKTWQKTRSVANKNCHSKPVLIMTISEAQCEQHFEDLL